MSLRYASVCSGIEAASVAWHDLGWSPVWFSEIEEFPSAVLKYRFPDVPNLGDMTKLKENEIYGTTAFDVLVGGTPCQSFSVAGLRKGLDDECGNLSLEYCRILIDKQPKWFVWENVPGVLSSKGGEDFSCILTAFRECGYSVAYRVLDAQNWGVAQRRRRVFVVGCLGDDWRPPYGVLFERESLRGDFTTGRKARKETAGTLTGGFGVRGVDMEQIASGALSEMHRKEDAENRPSWWDGSQTADTLTKNNAGGNQRMPDKQNFGAVLVPNAGPQASPADLANTLNTQFGDKMGLENEHINAGAPLFVPHLFQSKASEQQSMNPSDISPTLDKSKSDGIVVFDNQQITSPTNRSNPDFGDPSHTISKGNAHNACIVSIQANGVIPINTMTYQGRPSDKNRMGIGDEGDVLPTLTKNHSHTIADLRNGMINENVANTLQSKKSGYSLNALPVKTTGKETCPIENDRASFNQGENAQYDFHVEETETMDTVVSRGPHAVMTTAIRRITPMEAERLQGFPDGWTKIPYKGKPIGKCPDSPRYKAIGNSMPVPVMAWIGRRIDLMNEVLNELKK